jgi:hypothetical protein
MQKKLTITIDEKVYARLYRVVGPRRISRFVEQLVRPHVVAEDLDSAYSAMARETDREQHATEWSEGLIENDDDRVR